MIAFQRSYLPTNSFFNLSLAITLLQDTSMNKARTSTILSLRWHKKQFLKKMKQNTYTIKMAAATVRILVYQFMVLARSNLVR